LCYSEPLEGLWAMTAPPDHLQRNPYL